MQRLYFAAAILFYTGSLVFGADATWIGNVSDNFWDANNWYPKEFTGTLTVVDGSPYDPVHYGNKPNDSSFRPAKLNVDADGYLRITGGDLIPWSSDYINGSVLVKLGGLNIRSTVYIGRNATGAVTVNGGTFSQKYEMYLGYGTGGNGTLNILTGEVYFASAPIIGSSGGTGHVYIREAGFCYCPGNETTYFQSLVDGGVITTDPNYSIVVDYESGLSRTRITARRSEGAALPVPWHKTEDVGITQLSWTPDWFALSHDVYLGTDAAAVEDATTGSTGIYLGSTTGNTMAIPYSVIAGMTYYWRVDTVRSTGPEKGEIWSFKAIAAIPPRRMEKLDRGVIAVRSGSSNYIGWRLSGTDPQAITFNVYRGSTKINSSPITNSTNYVDTGGSTSDTYSVRAVINGQEREGTSPVSVQTNNYYTIPVQQVPGDTGWIYAVNDGAIGDLDGDGEYEIVIKRIPPDVGAGNIAFIEAYKLDGTFMWRINMGPNFSAWEEMNMIVYDFDGDGRAEVALKTAELTTFGDGTQIGDTDCDGITDYSASMVYNARWWITEGPEFLSVLDGRTGAELARTNYIRREPIVQWGLPSHSIGQLAHRAYKFHMAVAYLDGQRPSLVICRGIYHRIKMEAWDFRDSSLRKLWAWDSAGESDPNYNGQGNHNLSVGDVDRDGKDEITYGGCVVNHDGTGLYSTGLGHGDAMHLSDMDPCRPGLELWRCLENNPYGHEYRDAGTGEVIFRRTAGDDTGRCSAGDIDPRYRGYELWGSTGCPLYSCDGTTIRSTSPLVMNFMIYWDGDLLRELLDHNWIEALRTGTGRIDKWNYTTGALTTLLTATGAYSCGDTKGTPTLQADIFGDWREEAIWRASDNRSMRIYTTTIPTENRIYTLMHDLQYRLAVAWQVCGYNQPPHPGFFLGDGMAPAPIPHITLVDAACSPRPSADFNADCEVNFMDFAHLADAYTSNDLGSEANLNRDDQVDFRDLALLTNEWLD